MDDVEKLAARMAAELAERLTPIAEKYGAAEFDRGWLAAMSAVSSWLGRAGHHAVAAELDQLKAKLRDELKSGGDSAVKPRIR